MMSSRLLRPYIKLLVSPNFSTNRFLSSRAVSLPPPVDPPRRTLNIPLPEIEGGGTAALTYTFEKPLAQAGVRAGPIVCALHGAPGSTFDWRYVSSPLSRRLPNASLLRIEVPGFGASSSTLSPRSSPLGVDVARALARRALPAICEAEGISAPNTAAAAGEPPARWLLLGHSFGSGIAMLTAAELLSRGRTTGQAAVAGIALVNPVGLRPHQGMRPMLMVRGAARLLDLPPPFGSWWEATLRNAWVNIFGFPPRIKAVDVAWGQRCAGAYDFERMRAVVSGLRVAGVPTGILYSTNDKLVESAVSSELAVALAAAPVLVSHTAGHWAIKLAAEEIAELVDGVWARREAPHM